jgi:hypothetical protein
MAHSLTLPFPPSTNNLFLSIGRKRISSPKARAYAFAVRQAVLAAGVPQIASESVRVVIAAWMPNKRARDLDNLGLNAGKAFTMASEGALSIVAAVGSGGVAGAIGLATLAVGAAGVPVNVGFANVA